MVRQRLKEKGLDSTAIDRKVKSREFKHVKDRFEGFEEAELVDLCATHFIFHRQFCLFLWDALGRRQCFRHPENKRTQGGVVENYKIRAEMRGVNLLARSALLVVPVLVPEGMEVTEKSVKQMTPSKTMPKVTMKMTGGGR